MMQYDHDVTTLTPRHIVEAFQRAYSQVYGREAQVVHMFAEWYTVNGETVHRMTLFSETARLRDLAKQQQEQQQQQFIEQLLREQEEAAIAQQEMQFAHQQAAIAQQQAYYHQQAVITQQQDYYQQPQPRPAEKPKADRSMIQRLISRLRGS